MRKQPAAPKIWMPLYIGDYLRDTRRLSTLEHGAYLLLIMEYWQQGGLPDDDAQLARITGLSPSEWRSVRPAISSFFTNGWNHERIERELGQARERKDKARESAKARWGKSRMLDACSTDANALLDACSTHAQPHAQPHAQSVLDACSSPSQVGPSQEEGFSRGTVVSFKANGGRQ